ncbi:hypothetical protein SAMN03097699_3116 [Flavobacteriaceae bacterium MAR_2010_188]|nr:hypothetical protein SAMN03097699_3116 [Flavobacteriaceae bacterium MAR_2010_188]
MFVYEIMTDLIHDRESPFQLNISFNKLLNHYEEKLNSEVTWEVENAKQILDAQKPYPVLREGSGDIELIKSHKSTIAILLKDLFSGPLTNNEIKIATLPFQNFIFHSSSRLDKIVSVAGEDFQLKVESLSDDEYYIMACTVILKMVYGFDIKYRRPFFYEIPDESGVIRHYKILYNGDFVEVEATKEAPNLFEEDYLELLDNFNDIALWKKKIPPRSYLFKGFILASLVDVTEDQSISNIKTSLISDGKNRNKDFINNFREVFKSLFGFTDIEVGYSFYNKDQNTFMRVYGESMHSFLLNNEDHKKCYDALCERSFDLLINKKEFYAISDVDKFYELSKGKSPQYRTLKEQGYKSSILAPIANEDELLGVLELVSKTPKLLNSVNANRLKDVMPFIVSSVERSKREQENLVEAVIQQECTSIHSSVKWKFEKAALKFIQEGYQGGQKPQFDEIKIEGVYPLYGQIDVQGSSDARNLATKKDLLMQLNMLNKIFKIIIKNEVLPYYKQISYQITKYQEEITEEFRVDSEQQIFDFLLDEVNPILKFQAEKHPNVAEEIEDYFNKIDNDLNLIYFYRKNYDDTVALINKNMSTYIDNEQLVAQAYYPHYFERYKTDGVEHNIYIGKNISPEGNFNPVFLYNLRLWQLQVMCEMENEFYNKQHEYPISLDLASMILVFNQPLTIRFRMDEKKFDVDGTYNARYEVVKKRVDKAFIKGSNKRITQKGKICIVYSQATDETEYLGYIDFLQSKKILDTDVNIVEVQDLQSVTGLKAILVSILYHKNDEKEFYTYDDLMDSLKD